MKESQPPLTFARLHDQVEEFIKRTNRELPGAAERWAFGLGWAGAGLALLIVAITPRWLSPEPALVLVKAGFLVEVAGLTIAMALMLRREFPKLWRAKRKHAEEMDSDFRAMQEMLAWLKRHPKEQRLERLRFVSRLKTSMSYRLGLATGGIERLGVFPVLIALFFQFKDWKLGDWSSIGELNTAGALLAWALVLFYFMGWILIGLKVRLDTYEGLLEESLQAEAHSRKND